MSLSGSGWWTDDRLAETVTSAYVHSHLRTNEQELLKRTLYFGDGLTDDTYLDWILTKAKRFFLILVATGVPDQIFGIVDDSYDDDDLPVAEDAVPDLRLAPKANPTLDRRFYKTQFKFLTREVGDGEHIRYADEENVPITTNGLLKSITLSSKGSLDTVRLPTHAKKVYLRKCITIDPKISEEDILIEIAEMKKFSHEHVISVFGSYLHQGALNILLSPAPEYSLKAFLSDPPKSFEALTKSERRQTLINWPHCLANALAWLHANGGHHGAIRPSNIHVTHDYRISLGQMDGQGILCSTTKHDDIEAYQYASPERWKRAVTVQSINSASTGLPSGGRRPKQQGPELTSRGDPSARKRSESSNRTVNSNNAANFAFVPTSKKSDFQRFRLSIALEPGTAIVPPPRTKSKTTLSPDVGYSASRSVTRATMDRALPARAPSVLSNHSSDESRRKFPFSDRSIFAATPEARTAVVQTWKSVEHDSFAADVFSLGAVILDILTVLCKKSYSAFARYRSAKNRNAGRGGGLADASFHANLGQVFAWAQSLSDEAEKRVKKDDSQVLRAVGAIVQVTVQCLEKRPEYRLTSDTLESKVGEHIKKFAHINPLHCTAQYPPEPPANFPNNTRVTEEQNLAKASPPMESLTKKLTNQSSDYPLPPSNMANAARLKAYSSLDGMSDTVVGTASVHDTPRVRRRQNSVDQRDFGAVNNEHYRVPAPWTYQQPNDSAVDPRLTVTTILSDTGETGTHTYLDYSDNASDAEEEDEEAEDRQEDEEEDATEYAYPLPPTHAPGRSVLHSKTNSFTSATTFSMPANSIVSPASSISYQNRPLPQPQGPPRKSKKKVKSPPPSRAGTKEPTHDDIAMLHSLSKSGPASKSALLNHPARVSSLTQPSNSSNQNLNTLPNNVTHLMQEQVIREENEDEDDNISDDTRAENEELIRLQRQITEAYYRRQQRELERAREKEFISQYQRARAVEIRGGKPRQQREQQMHTNSPENEQEYANGSGTMHADQNVATDDDADGDVLDSGIHVMSSPIGGYGAGGDGGGKAAMAPTVPRTKHGTHGSTAAHLKIASDMGKKGEKSYRGKQSSK